MERRFLNETGNNSIRSGRWELFYIRIGSAVLSDGICQHKLFDFGNVRLHCVGDCQLYNVCLLGISNEKTLVDKDGNICFNERGGIGYQSAMYVDFCGIGRAALYACEGCSRLHCDNLELHNQANGIDSLGLHRTEGRVTCPLLLVLCPYFKE